MGRKPERTRYFVGTKDGKPLTLMVSVNIGSAADCVGAERFGQRYQWDTIEETDLMGYTHFLRHNNCA